MIQVELSERIAPTGKWNFLASIDRAGQELSLDSEEFVRSLCYLDDSDLDRLPFGRVLLAVVLATEEQMQNAKWYQQLPEKVRASCQRHLLHRLAQQAMYSLFFEFSLFRAQKRPFGIASSSSQTVIYDSFVKKMLGGDFVVFLQDYAALNTCFERICELWCLNTEEMFSRLAADTQLLEAVIGKGCSFDQLANVSSSLSEAHNQGHSVVRLEFNNGQIVFYKPRNCSSDVNYERLVAWLAERGARVCAVRMLDRGEYGWSEAALKKDCRNLEEVRDYYENSGALLCLLYALRGSDNHCENVIASGTLPVMIDTECLMHPDLTDIFKESMQSEFAWMDNSIFSTLFVPLPQTIAQKSMMPDLSAMGCVGVSELQSPIAIPALMRANTDSMELEVPETIKVTGLLQLNTEVFLDGKLQQFQDFGVEFSKGFVDMYNLLLRNRAELLAPDSPLMSFADQKVRVVARATMVYALLLLMSSRSASMRVTGDRMQYLRDILTQVTSTDAANLRKLIEAECQSMADDLDVPYFSIDASTRDFFGVPLAQSPFEKMIDRIESLSAEGLTMQLDYLQLVLPSEGQAS